ncbi:SDR family oxidoreductase [Aquilutibacter rugosus]|uniref:SDR family oxidoreductase n=1 Tax=Aquilutibacter rugosus TaxID=3115820 RepID=UPI002F3EFD1C
MKRVLIIGATSAIAEMVARIYAKRGDRLFIVGRSEPKLSTIASDLGVRGANEIHSFVSDLADIDAQHSMLDAAWSALGGIDVVLIAHGTLPDQDRCATSLEYSLREFNVNGTSVIALSQQLADRLGAGSVLAVISSVAGDRGRASNYLYGSAKAAVTAYLSGLGQSIKAKGIAVLTIKPGFVDTPMTAAFKKGALWAKPDAVAKSIVRAIDRRKSVAYVPGFWWFIMTIIKSIPEFVFRRINM